MISGTYAFPAWLSTVHHDGSPRYVSNLYPRLGETVRVRLRVGGGAPVRRVFLRTCPDGEQAFTPAMPGPAQPPSRWWKADLPVREPGVHYRFVLEADDGVWFYSAAGPAAHDPLDAGDFLQLTSRSDKKDYGNSTGDSAFRFIAPRPTPRGSAVLQRPSVDPDRPSPGTCAAGPYRPESRGRYRSHQSE